MTQSQQTIPAFINPLAGSADEARKALSNAAEFDVREVEPDKLAETIHAAVKDGAKRVLVSGGDGTIGTAAAALIGSSTELAILPGGTLNHFAVDLNIPTVAADAIALASAGTVRRADVGMVNGRLFLNTSSVGAYVRFVHTREYFEPRFGYRIASAIAALRILFQLRLLAVEVEVDGKRRIYRTPVVFIGVGERELQLPSLGKRVPEGRRGLHVMVVSGRSAGRVLALALNAVARGVKTAAKSPALDSFMVDQCIITVRKSSTVAVDGELVRLGTPLQYKLERDAIRVVCP